MVSNRDFEVRARDLLHGDRGTGRVERVGNSNSRNQRDLARGDRDPVVTRLCV